jgi:hypothetical protein
MSDSSSKDSQAIAGTDLDAIVKRQVAGAEISQQLAQGTPTVSPTPQEAAGALESQFVSSSRLSIDPDVWERFKISAPVPAYTAFHPLRAVVDIAKSIRLTVTPYSTVSAPDVKQAEFPRRFPSELHAIVEAAVAHEDQRTARFDLKASAFLSTSGILIPLIATLITVVSQMRVRGILLTSIAFSALAGIASFRALQLKTGQKLSLKVAVDDDGNIRDDARHRHTLTLMLVLKMEECVNDHRAKLIRASSILLATGTLVLCVASIILVA